MMNEVLVSACIITYNQENFIRSCIEGVVNQQVNFTFEIVIGEDGSTDETLSICKEYAIKYPQLIRLIAGAENKGMMKNWLSTITSCRGKFIAICEGDDYWTDALKLQKQVDYISKYENCNLVFTDAKVWNENKREFLPNWANINREKYEFKDLIEKNVITTCTALFRNPNRNAEISNYLLNFKIGDYPLYLFLLRSGYAYFLNKDTAVYRQHNGGVFSLYGPENFLNTNIEVLNTIMKEGLSEEERFYVKKSLVKWHYAKAVRLSSKLLFNEVRSYIRQNLRFIDIRYNFKYFVLLIKMYLFPKSKKGVFHVSSSNQIS